ncbi:hypothetical protein CORC01_10975 [Colletotrichum orchidophilum]|uniref:Uncharacterized protein n=1 Tax=Colletotrichum orchidophilum TaxID=1209926 RepID=A0A1G4AX53_9PEZI|nr:uncharacterized protein CORC01_10975 [Colletotrichum orchidophilum]OHE93748.1 hypothetical protein CORC01_10975 [Colletotrichum orchidophilum]
MTQKPNMSSAAASARKSALAMETGRIDWKEAFLFFYWDAKKLRTRPKEGHIIDRLIVEFFQQTRPSMADEGPVLNWDMTLFRLMNALRRQLGFDTTSEVTPSTYLFLSHIDPRDTWNKPPFVDWVRLETESQILFTYANNTITRFLDHLVIEAYGRQRAPWTLYNPYLKTFQEAHDLEDWSVPLPFGHAAEMLSHISWPEGSLIADSAGLVHPQTHEIRFDISLGSSHRSAVLGFPIDELTNHRIMNLTKRYYTAMLLWVAEMTTGGAFESLPGLLIAQFKGWVKANEDEDNDESLAVAKSLWEAYRKVGLQPFYGDVNSASSGSSSRPWADVSSENFVETKKPSGSGYFQVKEGAELPLELRIQSPSDKKHYFKNLYFRGHDEDEDLRQNLPGDQSLYGPRQ